jgi:hypothetical protein
LPAHSGCTVGNGIRDGQEDRAQSLRQRHDLVGGIAGVDLVARDDREAARRDPGQMRGQTIERAGDRAAVDLRRLANTDRAHLLHHVHRQGQEHWAGGGGVGVVEGAAHQHGQLVGVRDLLCPFHRRPGEGHQVTEEQRIGDRVTGILLSGGHHQRRLRYARIQQIAHSVAESAGGMEVQETRAPRGLRIAVGHRDGAGLLE